MAVSHACAHRHKHTQTQRSFHCRTVYWLGRTRQTTGNIWAPKYYTFPINDLPHRPPSKKLEKSRRKFQAKAIQAYVPWLNLEKKFQISFLQYANNVRTPLFRSMRQAQNTDTHAFNQLGVSQNSSPLWSNFTADKHIWHPLEPGCKSHEQIFHYRTAKNVQKQATVLLCF